MHKGSTFSRLMRHKAAPLLIILIVLVIVTMLISSGIFDGRPFSALFTRGFMSKGNLLNIFYKLAVQSFMLCGIACILIGGNIDLSIAGAAGISSMVFAWLCQHTQIHWGLLVVIVVVLAAIPGLINTFLVNKLLFPPFIATIGMSTIYAGLCNVMTAGNNIDISRQDFLNFGKISIAGFLPLTFFIAALVMILYQFVLSRTTLGRSIFMCGGNPGAARLSGLKPNRMRMILFVNNSVLAAIGGILYSAQIKRATPTGLVSSGFDFRVISASILGGVSFMGGSGSIGGAFIALVLLNVFENMLNVLGIQPYWILFASGALMVVALIVDYIGAEIRRKALLVASVSGD